jgi:hypothetical protein
VGADSFIFFNRTDRALLLDRAVSKERLTDQRWLVAGLGRRVSAWVEVDATDATDEGEAHEGVQSDEEIVKEATARWSRPLAHVGGWSGTGS